MELWHGMGNRAYSKGGRYRPEALVMVAPGFCAKLMFPPNLSFLSYSLCQQQLPDTGVPITRQRFDQMRHMFDEYVRSCTLQNWKFWVVSFGEKAVCIPERESSKL